MHHGDFPSSPVKNLLCNAGDMGMIPGQGTKIPHAVEGPVQPNKQLNIVKKIKYTMKQIRYIQTQIKGCYDQRKSESITKETKKYN